MAPELYNGVIAQVPFVDVITTMLDDTIPLTTGGTMNGEIKCKV
jgi:oligopeptidase B